jgi:hypothetical protein
LSIFRKQHPSTTSVRSLPGTPPPRSRQVEHPPVATSPDQAMQRVHAAAEEARKEIAALVEAEHEAIRQTIATACEEAEERLRGATERRIDSEIKRTEEAESKLRRELKRMVQEEIAKVSRAAKSSGNRNGSEKAPAAQAKAKSRPTKARP